MTHASLFSGIGGFDLAAQWMGWENVFQVEIDGFCQKVLAKNFPNVKRYGDIKQFDGAKYRGAVDVLSGGFPCQSFSLAGKGAVDLSLWKEMFRVIRVVGPRIVVAENVFGILARKNGMALSVVYDDLESEGYTTMPPVIIPACAVGAPHRRDRVWIAAYSNSHRVWDEAGEHCRQERESSGSLESTVLQQKYRKTFQQDIDPSRTHATNANNNGLQRGAINGIAGAIRQESGQLTAGLFQPGWQNFPTQSPICGRDDGIPPELDIIRRINEINNSQSITEIREFEWKALRAMWQYREFAAPSPNVYTNRVCNSVPNLPQERTYEGWELGKGYEETEELRSLWSSFYSKSLEEAQDLQRELLEYFRETERRKKMEKKQRVNRIKSLGNAIVPQVAFEIFKAIEQVTI